MSWNVNWGDLIGSVVPVLVKGGVDAIGSNADIKLAQQQAQAQKDILDKEKELAQIKSDLIKKSQEANNTNTKSKSNTALYIGLGIGGVILIGVIVFVVTRKK